MCELCIYLFNSWTVESNFNIVGYYIIKFTSLCKTFTYFSFSRNFLMSFCTIINAWQSRWNCLWWSSFSGLQICWYGWHVWLCQRVCEFYNVIAPLVCLLVIIYNVCISHIVWWCLVWCLLVLYKKFLGLFQCWYKYHEYLTPKAGNLRTSRAMSYFVQIAIPLPFLRIFS